MADDLTTKILIELREEIRQRFDAVEGKQDDHSAKFNEVLSRFDGYDTTIGKLFGAIAMLEARIEQLEQSQPQSGH